MNINGDGRSDLLFLTYKQSSGDWQSDHKVFVSKGALSNPLSQDTSERGLSAWQSVVDSYLTGEHLGKNRGWLIFDID